eukprot:TRINITY_DN23138_c0_g1_i1.p1 TRINITY_DN23138_c0_g1~~TRINITY_DN23138_c0_g1_i1.p1  ORF type:complete len:326 (+),score=40.55 TRINITY_DN23138_c0_g1_i1:70-978(+)
MKTSLAMAVLVQTAYCFYEGRHAVPLSFAMERLEMFEGDDCQGTGRSLNGADDTGRQTSIGECFIYKTGSVKVTYNRRSCEDYLLPSLEFTAYDDKDCSGRVVAKVNLMKGSCVNVAGRSVKFEVDIENGDYCKYLRMVQLSREASTITSIWVPSTHCEGTPVTTYNLEYHRSARQERECNNACCSFSRADSSEVSYLKQISTCTSYGKVIVSTIVYKDKECTEYDSSNFINQMYDKKPIVLGQCNSFNTEKGGMSLELHMSSRETEKLFCEVIRSFSKYDLSKTNQLMVSESDFNATVGRV